MGGTLPSSQWAFEQLPMQISEKDFSRGKCGHPEVEPLATRRRRNQVSQPPHRAGYGEAAGPAARRPRFSAGIWVSDQGF